MDRIRVALADDQVLFVESLKNVLRTRARDIEVVGIAHDGEQAISLVETTQPDLILLDVRMPTMDGVEATRAIHEAHPDIIIVMLTTFDDDEYVYRALEHGAVGYLLKDIPPSELIASIRALREGAVLVSPTIASKLLRRAHRGNAKGAAPIDTPPRWLSDLTARELQVLTLMVQGMDNREIAADLDLAEQTIKNAVSVIYSKLGVRSRVQAVNTAVPHINA